MSNRVSRRERRIRLYYLLAVMARMTSSATEPNQPPPALDWAGTFGVQPAEFAGWMDGSRPVPLWIQQLAISAYRVPPFPLSPLARIPSLVWILAVVVVVGVALSLLLRFLL